MRKKQLAQHDARVARRAIMKTKGMKIEVLIAKKAKKN